MHLGQMSVSFKVASIYECAFWRWQCKICKIFPLSSFQSPSQGGVHLDGDIFLLSYLLHAFKVVESQKSSLTSYDFLAI
jgi:hypothetical protein